MMFKRSLFLILSLMGAAWVYYDQSLIEGFFMPNWWDHIDWKVPAMIGAPFMAWLIAGIFDLATGRDIHAKKTQETLEKTQQKRDKEEPEIKQKKEGKEEKPVIGIEDIEEHANAYRKEGVMWLLTVFQREGRLVDFIQEDISPYDDAQIGAACREIHQGLRNALKDVLKIVPVVDSVEGTEIEVDEDYDPRQIRLTGNLSSRPPFKGSLVHPGWRIEGLRLPKFSENVRLDVISQAEVEVQ